MFDSSSCLAYTAIPVEDTGNLYFIASGQGNTRQSSTLSLVAHEKSIDVYIYFPDAGSSNSFEVRFKSKKCSSKTYQYDYRIYLNSLVPHPTLTNLNPPLLYLY